MMVESRSSLIERRNEVMMIGKVTTKKKNECKCRRRIKKKKVVERRRRIGDQVVVPESVPVAMSLRKLFLTCHEVFRGPGTVPSPADVHKMCCILDCMKPEDVGLSKNLQFFKPKSDVDANTRVAYSTIYKSDNFSLCILFLPAKSVIPLHNHPGMTVFSKLLLGTMHIKSYDWVDPENSYVSKSSSSKLRLAKLKANQMFTAPCNTSVLYPTSGGNIHEFTAVTPCAVLDVLGPPYSKDDGRDCSYYRDVPYKDFSNGECKDRKEDDGVGYGWLEEIEMPKDSEIDVIQYMGPQV